MTEVAEVERDAEAAAAAWLLLSPAGPIAHRLEYAAHAIGVESHLADRRATAAAASWCVGSATWRTSPAWPSRSDLADRGTRAWRHRSGGRTASCGRARRKRCRRQEVDPELQGIAIGGVGQFIDEALNGKRQGVAAGRPHRTRWNAQRQQAPGVREVVDVPRRELGRVHVAAVRDVLAVAERHEVIAPRDDLSLGHTSLEEVKTRRPIEVM